MVQAASKLARSFGVSTTVIGLTVIAVGAFLPELVVSLVGSNIFNILFVTGVTATIYSI